MTESNAQFLARMKDKDKCDFNIYGPDRKRLIALAEERVMIEDNELAIFPPRRTQEPEWWVEWLGRQREHKDLSTAICSVAAKIGEGNG